MKSIRPDHDAPPCPEPSLSPEQRATLLEIARGSLAHALTHGTPRTVDTTDCDPALEEAGASFVTLKSKGELRGCIGSLEAYRPLAEDVAENAYAAGFRDPRFPPLQAQELEDLHIQISVLSKPEPVSFDSESDLLSRIRPGIDGLILQEGLRRGTFLPSVWESLPDPREFLQHLKLKAGLPADYWSSTVKVFRYTTESFGEDEEKT